MQNNPLSADDYFSALDETVSATIVTIDILGNIQYVSTGIYPMFGFRTDEILGENVSILMESDSSIVHDQYTRIRTDADEVNAVRTGRNIFAKKRDGTVFPIHLTLEEISTDSFRGFIGMMTDLSQLREIKPRLSAALNTLSDGFALFDSRERLVLCNARFAEILGLPKELVAVGVAFDQQARHLGFHDGPLVRDALLRQPLGETQSFQYTLEADQEVLVRIAKLDSGDAVVEVRDEAAEAKRNEARMRANRLRALGELTGGVAHDFNNLLSVFIGNLELLDRQVADPASRAIISEALEAAEIGARLTARLLAFARRQPLKAETLDVNALIEDLSGILRRTLGENISIKLDLAVGLPHSLADRGALESGLINLAANARDAMPNGGNLIVGTELADLDADDVSDIPGGRFLRISVKDNGAGMSDYVRARVFEPFFTTKGRANGSGLGLSSLYGFARQTGGALSVTSELGKGSTFSLYLPVADSGKMADVNPIASTDKPLLGRTLLLVEDDDRVRRLNRRRVEALGADVLEAQNGEEALSILSSATKIDILFSDVVMPGEVDGYDLALEARKIWGSLPVLLTTGYGRERIKTEKFGRTGFSVLQKPFREKQLEEALRNLLYD